MANSTLTAMTSASALTGTELLYTVQGGADRKVTSSQIYQYVASVSSLGGTPGGVSGNIQYNNGGAFSGVLNSSWDSINSIFSLQTNTLILESTSGSQNERIASDGRVVIGFSSDEGTPALANSRLAIAADGSFLKMARFAGYGNQSFNSGQVATTTRSSDPDIQSIVVLGDQLYGLDILGSDGANFREAAFVGAYVDGTPAATHVPGRFTFWTTPVTATFSLERMRIDSAGNTWLMTATSTTGTTPTGAKANLNGVAANFAHASYGGI